MSRLDPSRRRPGAARWATILSALALLVVAERSRAQPGPRSDLLPPDAVFAVELDSAEAVLSAFLRAGPLFPLRPDAAEANLRGDGGSWLPYLPAASALIFTLELPYEERFRQALALWLQQARGSVAFGLVPGGGHDAAPVLVFELPAGRRLEPAVYGTYRERVGSWWVVSPARSAAERVREHLNRIGGDAAVSADRAGHRMRWNLRELKRRRPWMLDTTLGALRHFVALSPASLEVSWTSPGENAIGGAGSRGGPPGGESVRIAGLGDLAASFEPGAGGPAPRYVYCSLRLAGRVRVPEGLEAVTTLLGRDPLGILSALLRAWPVEAPDPQRLARNLTGRFQVLVLQSSSRFLPVVGLELTHPDRGRLELDRLLVRTGVCERHRNDPVPYTYPRRVPVWLRGNSMLRMFFRHYSRPRDYQVATAGGWVWLGPKREMDRVLFALRDERRARAGEDRSEEERGRVNGDSAGSGLGWVELNPQPFWSDLVFEQGFLAGDEEDEEDESTRRLREARGEFAAEVGLLAFSVHRDGGDLVLRRPAPEGQSLLTVLAARAYRSYGAIQAEEQEVRRLVRRELAVLHRACAEFRTRTGRPAGSLDQLMASGLWPQDPEVSRHYRLGIASGELRAGWLFAVPADTAAAGRRPGYLMDAEGRLLVGRTGAGGALRVPAGDPMADGWLPAQAD